MLLTIWPYDLIWTNAICHLPLATASPALQNSMHPEVWNKRCDLENAPAPATLDPWDGANVASSPVVCQHPFPIGLGSNSTRILDLCQHRPFMVLGAVKNKSGINEGTFHQICLKIRYQKIFAVLDFNSWKNTALCNCNMWMAKIMEGPPGE